MMFTAETVTDDRSDRFRVRVIADGYPEPPDVLGPLVRLEPGSYGDFRDVEILTSDYGQEDNEGRKDYEVAEKLAEAAARFSERNDRDLTLDLMDRYFRVFYGLELHVYNAGRVGAWIVSTCPATLDEYRAYAEGEAYFLLLEEWRNGEKVYSDGDVVPFGEWEDVESVYGYYGREYAKSAAKEMLGFYVESEIQKGNL